MGSVYFTHIRTLPIWIVILSSFSYPLTSVFLLQLGIPNGPANILLKACFASLYVYSFLIGLSRNKNFLNVKTLALILFFFIYSIRLIVDIEIRGIHMAFYTNSYIYLYYFLLSVLPCFSLMTLAPNIDFKKLLDIIFVFLILINVTYIAYFISSGTEGLIAQFAGRVNVKGEDGHATAVVNPITVGVYGSSLSLFCLSSLILPIKRTFRSNFFLLSCIPLGLINLFLGASRGPMFGFVCLSFVCFVFYFKSRRFSANSMIKFLILGALIIFTIFLIASTYFADTEIFLFDRFVTMFENMGSGEKETRDYMFEDAIQCFVDSPIIGKQFVGTYSNFYPHNVILEILMSLGIVGAITFIFVLLRLVISTKKIWDGKINYNYFPIFILAGCNFLGAMTTGGIITSPSFWIFITLIIIIPYLKTSNK